MTWTTVNPVTGTRTLVRCLDNGREGFASVRWTQGRPEVYGAVTSPRHDGQGNELPDVDVLDVEPTYCGPAAPAGVAHPGLV